MKSLALALVLVSFNAFADGRSLPSGEGNPLIVTSVYNAPNGEVQILQNHAGEFSAILRAETGGLAKLAKISGPARCDEWLKNGANGTANAACTLSFKKDSDGSEILVDARDLEGSSLFGLVKTAIKGRHGAL